MVKANATRKYRKSLSIMLASLLLASSFPVKGGTSLATSPSMTSATAAGTGLYFVYAVSSLNSIGDEDTEGGVFRGPEWTIPFDIPENITLTGRAHIMIQARGVDVSCNRVELNGTQINVLVNRNGSSELHADYNDVPSGTLKAGRNFLRFASRSEACNTVGNLDDFAITNVVIFYQTL